MLKGTYFFVKKKIVEFEELFVFTTKIMLRLYIAITFSQKKSIADEPANKMFAVSAKIMFMQHLALINSIPKNFFFYI